MRSTERLWTAGEDDRLRSQYATARAAGKTSELAGMMDRTQRAVWRRAGKLGLHASSGRFVREWKRPPGRNGVGKHLSDDQARKIFDRFKRSRFDLNQFCKRYGYTQATFRKVIRVRFPGEWDAVIESKAPRQHLYALGRDFEYRARDALRSLGYFVLRSPRSGSPLDLVAVKPGRVLFVQCKRGGSLPPKEWNELYALAQSSGATPVLAEALTRGMRWWRLLELKDGTSRQQPRGELNIGEF